MPSFSRAEAFLTNLPVYVAGRRIFVNPTTGSDTTGDGSPYTPYQTVTKGAADLRNARGDMLFIIGPGSVSEAPIKFLNLNLFSVVGLGNPALLGPPTPPTVGGRPPVAPVTLWDGPGGATRATIASGHQYMVGANPDFVNVSWLDAEWPNVTQGPHKLTSQSATTLTLETQLIRDNTKPPFTGGGDLGVITPVAMSFNNCANVFVFGLTLDGTLGGDNWPGITFYNCRNVDFMFNTVGRGIASFYHSTVGFTFALTGTNHRIENNIIGPSLASTNLTALAYQMGNLWIDGLVDVLVQQNQFRYQAGATPLPWFDGSKGALARIGWTNPGFGHLWCYNAFPAATDIAPNTILRSMRNDLGQPFERIFARRNFFPDVTEVEPVSVEWQDLIQDPQPMSFFRIENVVTQSDLIWDAKRTGFVEPGTFGESVNLTAAGLQPTATTEIRDAILEDGVAFQGQFIDDFISSRATPSDILVDPSVPIQSIFIDAPISSCSGGSGGGGGGGNLTVLDQQVDETGFVERVFSAPTDEPLRLAEQRFALYVEIGGVQTRITKTFNWQTTPGIALDTPVVRVLQISYD